MLGNRQFLQDYNFYYLLIILWTKFWRRYEHISGDESAIETVFEYSAGKSWVPAAAWANLFQWSWSLCFCFVLCVGINKTDVRFTMPLTHLGLWTWTIQCIYITTIYNNMYYRLNNMHARMDRLAINLSLK